MAVEEQTERNSIVGLASTNGSKKAGQKFGLVPNRRITKLAFMIAKFGSPTGDVTFTIRAWSGQTILNSKVWGDAFDLPEFVNYELMEWAEVEFDTPKLIDEYATMNVEFSGGDANNQVFAVFMSGDVKPDECMVLDLGDVHQDSDFTYRYTYEEAVGGAMGGAMGKARGFDFRGRGFRP